MKYFIMAMLCMVFTSGFADSYVCPKSYQTVMTGATMQQVAQACGQPTQSYSEQGRMNQHEIIKRWIYIQGNTQQSSNQAQNIPYYGPKMVVTFVNNKVKSVDIRNQTGRVNFPCYQFGRIAVGDNSGHVLLMCGQPSFVNTYSKNRHPQVQVTTWIYKYGPYRPEMIFIFHGNELVKIKMGAIQK